MRTELHRSHIESLSASLRRGIDEGSPEVITCLNILLAVPEYARTDSEIRELLISLLSSKALGYRQEAARILHAIGDPLGILHLTYNSLRSHPILELDHTKISGWRELVIRHAEDLTGQCIDLLVADMMGNFACFHGRTLAQLPAEKIVQRMRSLLEEGGKTAQYAAYVLAAKDQYDDIPDILENWLRTDGYPKLPLRALSYLRGKRALSIAKEYTDPSHPLYHSGKYRDVNRHLILPFATYVQDVLEADSTVRTARIMEKYSRQEISHLMTFNPATLAYDRQFSLRNPINFFLLGSTGVSTTEFLSDHTNQREREVYATKQREAVERLFRENALNYDLLRTFGANQFMHSNALPDTGDRYPSLYGATGMRIYFDQADYLFAATDWLLHPQHYLNFD
jgi:hypothetical protein